MANEFVARKGIISLGGLTFPYLDVPSTYTAGTDDYYLNIVSSGVVLNLPTAAGIKGKQYVIKNSTSVGIIIDAFSAETIDNTSIITLGADDSVQLVSNGTGWKIVNLGSPVSGATNNALLISDGSVGGLRANSNLTYDGSTLREKQVNSGSTYSEITPVFLSAITSYTGQNTNVLSITRTNVMQANCEFRLSRAGGTRSGTITAYPFVGTSAYTYSDMATTGASQVASRIYFTADSGNNLIHFYLKLPGNWSAATETGVNVYLACRSIKQ